jgi:hypothetical protein
MSKKLKVKTTMPANRPSFNEWSKIVNASRMYDESHVQEELRFDEYLREIKRKPAVQCFNDEPVIVQNTLDFNFIIEKLKKLI